MTDAAQHNYGFAWEIRTWHNRRMIGHAGSGPGFFNMVARFPDDDLTIVSVEQQRRGQRRRHGPRSGRDLFRPAAGSA